MKKRFCVSLLVLSLFAAPLAALEQGITLNGGLEVSIIGRPFLYEEVAYKLAADNGIGFTVGARINEDLFFPGDMKFLYLSPYIQLDLNNYYLGAGITINSGLFDTDTPIPFVKTGVVFGDFDWPGGRGDIDIGCDFMPTLLWDVIDEGNAGAAIAGSILSVFNFFHIYVGVNWFITF